MHNFYRQITMRMYIQENSMINQDSEFVAIKNILDLLLNKSKSFE